MTFYWVFICFVFSCPFEKLLKQGTVEVDAREVVGLGGVQWAEG